MDGACRCVEGCRVKSHFILHCPSKDMLPGYQTVTVLRGRHTQHTLRLKVSSLAERSGLANTNRCCRAPDAVLFS